MNSVRESPLQREHLASGGKMVEFAGWMLPIHYGSQMAEHHAVRRGAGLFDVSHMTISDLVGEGAKALLRRLLANDIERLDAVGRALYSCLLNPDGGVIDDLIVYRRAAGYRIVSNAATRSRVVDWIGRHCREEGLGWHQPNGMAMVALQGPDAGRLLAGAMPSPVAGVVASLGRFRAVEIGEWMVARTGYTGEDGYELMLPVEPARQLWRSLVDAGATPCGLGARDTLRLEAGLALYGHEMDEGVSPMAAGLAWTVDLRDGQRDFVGRSSLTTAVDSRQVGVVLKGRGVLRDGLSIVSGGRGIGQITSGSFSPTLGHSIALARLHSEPDGSAVLVQLRGHDHEVELVTPPFVRSGKAAYRPFQSTNQLSAEGSDE